jgi:GH18 family chitinase
MQSFDLRLLTAKVCLRSVMVYTTDWAQYRTSSNDQLPRPAWCNAHATTPGAIDPAVATHIFYAFAKIHATTYAVEHVDWRADKLIAELQVSSNKIMLTRACNAFYNSCLIEPDVQTQALKVKNPRLKTLISIGGWSFSRGEVVFKDTGSQKIFPAMAASSSNRAKFIASATAYAKSNHFDGIDMDWWVATELQLCAFSM